MTRRNRLNRAPRDVGEVFKAYGPVTPQGLYNEMRLAFAVGDRRGALELLEACLIMDKFDRSRAHPRINTRRTEEVGCLDTTDPIV